MIYIDIDGVLLDFIGTARKHFGIELKLDEFGTWCWGTDSRLAAEFYAVAELQPWALELPKQFRDCKLITKDWVYEKQMLLYRLTKMRLVVNFDLLEAPDKSEYCGSPIDLLIDDNIAECERWRAKGGIAWHFDLAAQDPFAEFIKWWDLAKKEAT